jgi:hypothetical protein
VDAVRRILPALAAALACAACTVPIFDPSMSWAARTLDKIPVVSVTDPLDPPLDDGKPRFDLKRDRLAFMPERTPGGFDISKGFVIRTYEDWNEIWYEWFAGSVQWIQGATFPAGETMPFHLPVWLKTGPYLGAIVFDSEAWAERLYANTVIPELTFNPAYHTPPITIPNDILADVAPPIGAIPHIVGMSVVAQSALAQDRVTALVRTAAGYTEAFSQIDQTGPLGWSAVWAGFVNYPLGTFLGNPWHLNYCHDFNAPGRSFAQSFDGKKWTTWTWWSTVPGYAKLTGITHRIDTVLSTDAGPGASHLFSTEDQIGRVYRYDGTGDGELVAQFGLGPLRFLGEAYIGASWRMLFSCCVIDYTNEQFRFQIRAIDTDQLLAAFE